MTTVLTINSAVVDRSHARIVLNSLRQTIDGYDSVEFTELGVRPPGTFGARHSCVLTVDGVTVFSGQIVASYYSGIGSGPIDVGYRAMGLEWLANRVQIKAADASGRLVYNLSRGDPGYAPALSGLSVGAILKKVFDLHATALTAIGVTGYTQADLDALVVVPPEPIYLTGGLWNVVRQLLSQWCNKYAAWVNPSDGKIAIRSQLALTAYTLTLDSDPIAVPSIARDQSECFTSVVCRGAANVQAAYLSIADGTLVKGWSTADESAWTYNDFLQPKDAADLGAVTAMSSTTLTVKSDDAAATWGADYWGPLNAEVVAYDPAATGITFSESRRITANTALAAAGTSVLTVDAPFNNSGYKRYSIRGLYAPSSLVWRKFTIPATYVAQHLAQRFSHAFPWAPVDGVLVQTDSPAANICYNATCVKPYLEWPVTFTIVPYDGTTDGYIVFDEPVVKPFGTPSKLLIGGASVDGIPCDIKAMVPYSVGALTATAPTTGYQGTAYSVDGLQNVLYRDFPGWLDYKDQASYQTLAQEALDTVKNTVVEGAVIYYGKLSAALVKGQALNLAAVGYTTGFETIAAPIRSVTLDYVPRGSPDGAAGWVTRIEFSNRLKPFCGDRFYAHASYGASAALGAASLATPSSENVETESSPLGYGAGAAVEFEESDLANLGLGLGDPGRYRPRTRRKLHEPTGPREPGLSDKDRNAIDADDRENRRRVAARAERRRKESIRQTAANDADDRENRRRVAERQSRRDAHKLSTALGNPNGPRRDNPDQSDDEFQGDRAIDAHLAELTRGEGGSS